MNVPGVEVWAYCPFPFVLNSFFRMGKNLKDILEIQFDLLYHLNMTIADYDENDIRDNSWIHSRLVLQKKNEAKARREALGG